MMGTSSPAPVSIPPSYAHPPFGGQSPLSVSVLFRIPPTLFNFEVIFAAGALPSPQKPKLQCCLLCKNVWARTVERFIQSFLRFKSVPHFEVLGRLFDAIGNQAPRDRGPTIARAIRLTFSSFTPVLYKRIYQQGCS